MRHQAVKVILYPTIEQKEILSQHFGCARWWWNQALTLCIETYKATGKGLSQSALNAFLPKLKKHKETQWLSECYSQVLQATTLNIRAEGIRILSVSGTGTAADGGDVSPKLGRKSKLRQFPVKSESHTIA